MIAPKKPQNVFKANRFIRLLNGVSPADLDLSSQRNLLKIFYDSIKIPGGRCMVEQAPKKNVYAVLTRLYEESEELIREDARQILYEKLRKLEVLLKQRETYSDISLEYQIVDIEENICALLENTDNYDKKLEDHYLVLQGIKAKQEVSFSSSQGRV